MQQFNLLSFKNKLENQEPSESERGHGKDTEKKVN
jgi:hypothetical protein